MNVSLFICSIAKGRVEEMNLRISYAIMGVFLLLTATCAAGSFKAEMDVDTYVDAENADQSFFDSKLLWANSKSGEPTEEVYLSFINLFGSQGVFKPEQIASATLTLDATQVDRPGMITACFLDSATLDATNWNDKKDYDASVCSSPVNVDEAGSYTWDVTDIIKKAVETCVDGCGYTIVIVAEDDAAVGFASTEASGIKPTLEYVTEE